MELKKFDYNKIFDFLVSQNAPVFEVNVLRYLIGNKSLKEDGDSLFELHFSLYHYLYKIRRISGKDNYYLHLDPMRIRLLKLPGDGKCFHYKPKTGKFCGDFTDFSINEKPEVIKNFCEFHLILYKYHNLKLHFDPMDEFYSNVENIFFGNSEVLKKLQKGVILYSVKKGEVEKALKFFGLTRPDRKILVRKFHKLAKIYHPDIYNGDDSRMKELNGAYQVLREIFVV